MPTYVSLINWTDQGIKNFKDTVDRARQAGDLMSRYGVKFTSIHWTVGPYDIVAVVEADDDEGATAALLALGAQGNVRSTTMRAYDGDTMARIIDRVG
jgi:uncharacterized protein with GYD domain